MQPYLIAELSCVHLGDFDRAKMLIDLAKESGCSCVKFQKRTIPDSVPLSIRDKPHPNKQFAYGKTYLEHRHKLEFNIDKHEKLKQYCDSIKIDYACSVWDEKSADKIIQINPAFIKIPSALNSDWDLINHVFYESDKKIHISLGMTNSDNRQEIFQFASVNDINKDKRIIFYHCTSIYPCPIEHLYLNEISNISRMMGSKNIGFSNHSLSIEADILAYALGARYFERHFVDTRECRHNDSKVSLIPKEMLELKNRLGEASKMLQDRPFKLSVEEKTELNKLRPDQTKNTTLKDLPDSDGRE